MPMALRATGRQGRKVSNPPHMSLDLTDFQLIVFFCLVYNVKGIQEQMNSFSGLFFFGSFFFSSEKKKEQKIYPYSEVVFSWTQIPVAFPYGCC